MKTPRLDAFVPPERVRELASPLDDMPTIQPPHSALSQEQPQPPRPSSVPPPTPLIDAASEPPSGPATAAQQRSDGTALDLTEFPTRKATFPITDAEFVAFEELKLDLLHKHDVKLATKENLFRCAIQHVIEDYRRNGEQSFIFQKLTQKRQ